MNTQTLLIVIAILLFLILLSFERLNARLKERFPTAKEEDREWGSKRPDGLCGSP